MKILIFFSNFEHFESYIYIQYIYIFLDFYKKNENLEYIELKIYMYM